MGAAAAALIANLCWAANGRVARRRFRRALQNPAAAQLDVLTRSLRDNQDTVVGRAHGFAQLVARPSSDRARAYQEAVPIVTYDEIEPLIARVAAGERGVLTRADVRRLAPSSGSTSAAKLIPYTGALQREFSSAVDAWIADLYATRPRLMAGQAYWSVSPSVSVESTLHVVRGVRGLPDKSAASVVPVGFEDDSAYLGGVRQRLVQAVLAVPADVRHLGNLEAFQYATLLFLLRARHLRLISVWHPSFLTRLLDALPNHFDRLLDDISRGALSPPVSSADRALARLARELRPDPARAAELRALASHDARHLWPNLMLVSCWGDGAARHAADCLGNALAGIEIQRKGLIATEAIVSIPFGALHPVAVRSHFFEFVDPRGHCRLTHELETGVEYAPVVTTAGGLYRYRLGDRVVVDGWIDRTPSIRFVGRSDAVSDRFGEKLSDGFVTAVLTSLFAEMPAPRFAMLAPEETPRGCAYTLLVETGVPLPSGLEAALERALRENPHYAWCVDLGQLRPSRVVTVGPDADRAYVDECVARGQRLGDVKPVSLHPDSGWERRLQSSSRTASSRDPIPSTAACEAAR